MTYHQGTLKQENAPTKAKAPVRTYYIAVGKPHPALIPPLPPTSHRILNTLNTLNTQKLLLIIMTSLRMAVLVLCVAVVSADYDLSPSCVRSVERYEDNHGVLSGNMRRVIEMCDKHALTFSVKGCETASLATLLQALACEVEGHNALSQCSEAVPTHFHAAGAGTAAMQAITKIADTEAALTTLLEETEFYNDVLELQQALAAWRSVVDVSQLLTESIADPLNGIETKTQ